MTAALWGAGAMLLVVAVVAVVLVVRWMRDPNNPWSL